MNINTLCGLLLILAAGEVAAVDGKLVVNGFEIPNRWFANYSRHHNSSKDGCNPAIDDEFMIEQMASLVLPLQEAETRELTLPPGTVENIESWFEKAGDFPDDTDPEFNAKGEVIYLRKRRFQYAKLLANEFGDDDVLAAYKERIKNKNPGIVNRQIVKVLEFDFNSRADAEKVQSIFQAGGDYLAAARLLLDDSDVEFALEKAKKWIKLYYPKNQADGSPEFKVGDSFVNQTRFWWKFNAVIASDIVPVIGIDEKLLDEYSTTRENIHDELHTAAYTELLKELRQKATVTLDGALVPVPENFDEILNRGGYRTNLTTHLCTDF